MATASTLGRMQVEIIRASMCTYIRLQYSSYEDICEITAIRRTVHTAKAIKRLWKELNIVN